MWWMWTQGCTMDINGPPQYSPWDIQVYDVGTDTWYEGGNIPSHRFRRTLIPSTSLEDKAPWSDPTTLRGPNIPCWMWWIATKRRSPLASLGWSRCLPLVVGGDGHFHRWRHMAPKEFWQSIFTHQLLTLICSFLCQFHANSHMRWTQLQSLRASKLSW